MKRNYFSILFFIKKTKLLKNGEAPVCLRITVNGHRAEVQIKRIVEDKRWNNRKECSSGKERKDLELNHYLDTVRSKILQIHRELELDNKPITAEIIKQLYYGKDDTPKMLLIVFAEHNQKCRGLLGKEYVLGTVLRYERTIKYLSEYLRSEYNRSDIPLRELNNAFVTGFEHFIKTQKLVPKMQPSNI